MKENCIPKLLFTYINTHFIHKLHLDIQDTCTPPIWHFLFYRKHHPFTLSWSVDSLLPLAIKLLLNEHDKTAYISWSGAMKDINQLCPGLHETKFTAGAHVFHRCTERWLDLMSIWDLFHTCSFLCCLLVSRLIKKQKNGANLHETCLKAAALAKQ